MGGSPVRINVRVKPRASRDMVEGWKEGVLIVRLSTPPVDGAANTSLLKFLAKKAGVSRGRVRIVTGEKGRSKILEFDGIALEQLRERLK